MIGIICAMGLEADGIIKEMNNVTFVEISGMRFHKGNIGDNEVVVCVCGVGKVFAGICAQTMILSFKIDTLINVGVAGSLDPTLKVFDVVVATDVCQHDMDTSPIGDPPGLISGINKVYFEASEPLSCKIKQTADNLGIHTVRGRIATGDQFIDTAAQRTYIKEKFDAAACEMEGGAIAQVCAVNNVSFALLRAISDSEGGDYSIFASKAAENSARIICAYLNKK